MCASWTSSFPPVSLHFHILLYFHCICMTSVYVHAFIRIRSGGCVGWCMRAILYGCYYLSMWAVSTQYTFLKSRKCIFTYKTVSRAPRTTLSFAHHYIWMEWNRERDMDRHTFSIVCHHTIQQQFRIDKWCAFHNWGFLLLSIHLNCWPIRFRTAHRGCPSWWYENHRLSSNRLWSMVEFPQMFHFLWSDHDMMIPGCVLWKN